MNRLKVGDRAPSFSLPNRDNKEITTNYSKSKFTILYFYPKDDTPGCTTETLSFEAALKRLTKLGCALIGISGGDAKSKTKFCTKHNLTLTLLSDTDFSVSKKFGSFGEKSFMGRRYNGIFRDTYVIDSAGLIVEVFCGVDPKTHVAEVLDFIEANRQIEVRSVAPKVELQSKIPKEKKTKRRPKSRTKQARSKPV